MLIKNERGIHVAAFIINIVPVIDYWSDEINILTAILFIPFFFLFTIFFLNNPPRAMRTWSPYASLLLLLLLCLISLAQYTLTGEYAFADYVWLAPHVSWPTLMFIRGLHSLIAYFFLMGVIVHFFGIINPLLLSETRVEFWVKMRRIFLASFYTLMLGFMLYVLAQDESWGIIGYIVSVLFICMVIFPIWHLAIKGYLPDKTERHILMKLFDKLRGQK